MTRWIVLIVATTLLALTAWHPHAREVSRSDMGDAWPLAAESGTIEFRACGPVVFTAGGRIYAVNGTAKNSAGLPDIDAVWADEPRRLPAHRFLSDSDSSQPSSPSCVDPRQQDPRLGSVCSPGLSAMPGRPRLAVRDERANRTHQPVDRCELARL